MSKKTIETLIKISNNITTKIIKGTLENPIPGKKWKAEVEGEFKDMSSKSSFENVVLSFIKEQKAFNQEMKKDIIEVKSKIENVEFRLDKLEKDMIEVKSNIKEIKNTPTMKQELKK
ncbi:MAG: hypothetical protein HDR43_00575 [Mycoplasma sp.]|nr:hypothetical protein [Mycoplasma sp.]